MATIQKGTSQFVQAGVDPHVKRSMPEGQNPKDGETAREMADKQLVSCAF